MVKKTFPLTKPPQRDDKFPFQNTHLYTTNGEYEEEEEEEIKVKKEEEEKSNEKRRTFGFTAQQSLTYLEATGRKLNLQHVPWFRSTWRRK